MSMSLSGLIAYCGALAVAAVLPGPQMFAILAESIRFGWRRSVWITAGMVLGDLIYLAGILAGLAVLAEVFSGVIIALKWMGIAYLTFLAVQYWQASDHSGSEGTEVEAGSRSRKATFLSGMLVTIGNPKSVLFYVSILPTVVNIGELSRLDMGILIGATGVVMSVVQFPIAVAGARARAALNTPANVRLINRAASICMGGAAAAIVARS